MTSASTLLAENVIYKQEQYGRFQWRLRAFVLDTSEKWRVGLAFFTNVYFFLVFIATETNRLSINYLLLEAIFVAVVTIVVAVGVSAKRHDDICKTDHDGNFIRDPDDCSRYFECNDTELVKETTCWDDLLFDMDSIDCRPPDTVTCQNVILSTFVWVENGKQCYSIKLFYSFSSRNQPSRMTRVPITRALCV